jgi:hypothetical protein
MTDLYEVNTSKAACRLFDWWAGTMKVFDDLQRWKTANIYKMATTYFNSSFTYCPYCCLEHVPNQIEAAEESGQSESILNQYDFLVGIGVGLLWFLIGLGNIFFFPWLCMLGGSAWFWTKSNIFRFVHVQTHFSALRSALQRTHVEYILRSNYLHIIT